MTNTTTPTRPPGNEIRVKCAQALGLVQGKALGYSHPQDELFYRPNPKGAFHDLQTWTKTYSHDNFDPLNDLNCAMELVEALRKEGWSFDLGDTSDERYYCKLTPKCGAITKAYAATLPLAICNAFLATKGLEP